MKYADLVRRPHKGRPWPTYWYDPVSGDLLIPGAQAPVRIAPDDFSVTPLLAYLALPGANGEPYRAVVYLAVGDSAQTAPPEEWYTSAALDGWYVDYRGGSPKERAAICTRERTTIHVRHTATWFPGAYDVRQMRAAYDALQKRLARDFGGEGDSIVLKGTPAQTGLHLLDVSLPHDRRGKPYRYPVLPDELLEFLSQISFQHRRELVTIPDAPIEGFSVYDARLSYAAYLRDVPTGAPICDYESEFLAYRPGWYRVKVSPPVGWSHIGLARNLVIPAMADGAWPRRGTFETWISEPELRLMKSQGWGFTILQRVVWPTGQPGGDPLRMWSERLIAAYISAENLADAELSRLLKGAVRHLIHDTIGSFNRSATFKRVTVPMGEPVDPTTIEAQTAYGYLCKIPVPISADRMRYAQPQIAGHIWAKNRATLARYALQIDPGDILALLTDAVLLARYVGYSDRPPVNIGAYRLKGTINGPLPPPQGWDDLAQLTHAAEATYGAFYGELFESRDDGRDDGQGAIRG